MKFKLILTLFLLTLFAGTAAAFNETNLVNYPAGSTAAFNNTYTTQDLKTARATIYPAFNESSPYDIPAGCIAWYRFDENTGSTVTDSMNSSNNATATGLSWGDGKYNSGGVFSKASTSYVPVKDPVLGSSAFTIVGWANISNYYAGQAVFTDYNSTRKNVIFGGEFASGVVYFYVGGGATSNSVSNSNLTHNGLTFMAMGFDGANDTLYSYVGMNKTVKTVSDVNSIGADQSASSYIGRYYSGNGYINATIDNIMFFNRTLNDTEIQNIYKDGLYNLEVRTSSNETYSPQLNGSGVADLPFSESDSAISGLRFRANNTAVAGNITIHDYYATMPQFNVGSDFVYASLVTASIQANKTTGYAPLTVQFSTPLYEDTSVLWDFGDGNQSTEFAPVHTFSQNGTYTVNVTVTGPENTANDSVMIEAKTYVPTQGMDTSTLYLLIAIAGLLFLVSIIAFVTGNENVITVTCMFISAVTLWKIGNVFISNSLRKFIGAEVLIVNEPTAAIVFRWLAMIAFLCFLVQIFLVVRNNYSYEDE